MLSHEQAVLRIGGYLLGSKDRGVIFRPDKERGLECYVNADFAGGWVKSDPDDADNVLSRMGYVIFYADCPLLWVSRMQTEIALSTAESEYIALSTAMREVIALTNLIDKVNTIFSLNGCKPKIHCKVFEDNESCIAMAKNKRFSPRTKHIAIKYHHFRSCIGNKVTIHSINTKEQTANILTKPLDSCLFQYLRIKLSGW